MQSEERSTTPGIIMIAVGAALIGWGLIWATIIGFYQSELLFIVAILAVGALLAWLGQKSYQTAKRENAVNRIKQRDAGKA